MIANVPICLDMFDTHTALYLPEQYVNVSCNEAANPLLYKHINPGILVT